MRTRLNSIAAVTAISLLVAITGCAAGTQGDAPATGGNEGDGSSSTVATAGCPDELLSQVTVRGDSVDVASIIWPDGIVVSDITPSCAFQTAPEIIGEEGALQIEATTTYALYIDLDQATTSGIFDTARGIAEGWEEARYEEDWAGDATRDARWSSYTGDESAYNGITLISYSPVEEVPGLEDTDFGLEDGATLLYVEISSHKPVG